MAGPAEEQNQVTLRPPPPLPPRLLALGPIVYVATGVWALIAVALAVARYGFAASPPIWLWTALAGVVMGILGTLLMLWQRQAARRGSRTAQRVD